jgi:hypothetical protein
VLLDTLKSSSETFWLALKCKCQISNVFDPRCDHLYHNLTSQQIINKTCPDILFMPARTLAFDHMNFAYSQKVIVNVSLWSPL